MSLASAWLEDFRTWVDGLLGDRLSAALAQVKAAVARGTVAQDVAPQVQRCADVLGTLRVETQAYLAVAAPHHADSDVKERSDRLVAIWTELWAQWSDPACTRPRASGGQGVGREHCERGRNAAAVARSAVGMAPAWSAVVVVVVGGVAYAVSEVGSAWAISTTADAEVALEQVRLQRKELDARVTASQDGRTLPPSTLPPPELPRSGADAAKVVKLALAGLRVAVGAGVLAYAVRR